MRHARPIRRGLRSCLGVPVLTALTAATIAAWLIGCDTARVVAPTPPLGAASAALYAVDVEFAEPLDKTSAEDPTRYTVYPSDTPGSPATIMSATLVDSFSLRGVQLIIPTWFGDSTFDRRSVVVQSHGVLDSFGRSTGQRSVTVTTGLAYQPQMKALFDAHCSSCHGPSNPAGSYRTDGYTELFGPGTSPTPNVIAGDPKCLTVVK